MTSVGVLVVSGTIFRKSDGELSVDLFGSRYLPVLRYLIYVGQY